MSKKVQRPQNQFFFAKPPTPGPEIGPDMIAARGGRRWPAVAAGGVGRPNFEDPGNYEPKPPEPLQINLFGEKLGYTLGQVDNTEVK